MLDRLKHRSLIASPILLMRHVAGVVGLTPLRDGMFCLRPQHLDQFLVGHLAESTPT